MIRIEWSIRRLAAHHGRLVKTTGDGHPPSLARGCFDGSVRCRQPLPALSDYRRVREGSRAVSRSASNDPALAIALSSSVLVAGLRAVMRPLLQDPGYAVIAVKHDIDPPPGLVGRFLNVAREISAARSKDQLGLPAPGPAEGAVAIPNLPARPHECAIGSDEPFEHGRDNTLHGYGFGVT